MEKEYDERLRVEGYGTSNARLFQLPESKVPEVKYEAELPREIIPVMPKEIGIFIEYLTDANLTFIEIDEKMGWINGETQRKVERYPLLARTVKEAKVLALRKVGLNRIEVYRAIADALKATKMEVVDKDGEGGVSYRETADHKIRLSAAQAALNILGDTDGALIKVENNTMNVFNLTPEEKVELERLRGNVLNGGSVLDGA